MNNKPPMTSFGNPKMVTMKYQEQQLAAMQKQMADLQKFTEERLAAEKRGRIKAELDNLVLAGKVLPAEREAGLDGVLAALPDNVLVKFSDSEGKEQSASLLDRQLAILRGRPALVKFGERVKSSKAAADDERAKVEQHYEQFSEVFEKMSTPKEELLQAFDAKRKRDPKLTAEQFLSVA